MLPEISVLPKQDEEFSKGQMTTSVTFVGHKSTTRHEQIQENWHIEVNDVEKKPLRRSPRKATAATLSKKTEQPLRRSPRKATATLPQSPSDSEDSDDSDGGSDGSDDSDRTMSHSDDDDVEEKSSKKRLEFDTPDDTPTRKRKSQKNNQRGKKKTKDQCVAPAGLNRNRKGRRPCAAQRIHRKF